MLLGLVHCLNALRHAHVLAGDWLVAKLQALVEVGFRMATGTAEALRPVGLALQVPRGPQLQ